MSAKKIAVIDAETDPFQFGCFPHPFAWCYKDEIVEMVFWGDDATEQLVEFIETYCDKNHLIYAHNGGKFDFHFLIPHLKNELKLINGRIAVCNLGKAELRDSWLIFPEPLSAYKKDEISYEKLKRENREEYKNEIIDYLRGDCRYLLELVTAFYQRFDDKLTAPSAAMNELKLSGYTIETTGEHYDSRIRPFYYGGRVQCFEKGVISGPLVYVDINSAYPFAMCHPHPSSMRIVADERLPSSAGGWLADISAISRGALPIREEKTGKLQFPHDDSIRRYTVTGWEIFAGLETGTLDIKKIHRVYKFGAYCSMKNFIHEHYNARKKYKKEGNKIQEKFEKLVMNSVYGKFAQDSREFKEYRLMDNSDDYPDGDDWEHESDLFGRSLFQRSAATGRFYNCATAASITGFVRAYLWRAICNSTRPIYCDTDSLICEQYVGDTGLELGQWKVEANIVKAYIGGRKLYSLETMPDAKTGETWKCASKGFRMDARQLACHIEHLEPIHWQKSAPAYSAKYGPRFLERKIKFI